MIKGNEFRGSEGQWEQLKLKKVNRKHVTLGDMRTYKKIFLTTNAHWDVYHRGGAINVIGGKTFRERIDLLSASRNGRVSNRSYSASFKILRCPLADYITILPGRRTLDLDKSLYSCRKEK